MGRIREKYGFLCSDFKFGMIGLGTRGTMGDLNARSG